METIKFSKSHILLLEDKTKIVTRYFLLLKKARSDYQNTLNIVAGDLGIPELELNKWEVSGDRKGLDRLPEKKGK